MDEQYELFPETGMLDLARDLINGPRQASYGSPTKCGENIAAMWSLYLEQRDGRLTAHDVYIMMALLKMARLMGDPYHKDSIIDAVGYLALTEKLV